jgi:hypothetical protein
VVLDSRCTFLYFTSSVVLDTRCTFLHFTWSVIQATRCKFLYSLVHGLQRRSVWRYQGGNLNWNDRQHKRTENENTTQNRSNNTGPTKYWGWTQVRWKGQQFMLYFSYVVSVSFICEGNQRKPPSCCKSLTNFIT